MAGDVAESARDIQQSTWLDVAVRVGLVAYGLVHLVVAGLALDLAGGDRSGTADQTGALAEVARSPWGTAWLVVIAVGMAALTAWQALEAAVGHRDHTGWKRWRKRASSALKAVIYAYLGVASAKLAWRGRSSGGEETPETLTSRLLSVAAGQWLVLAVAIGIGVAGVVQAYRGVTFRHADQLTREGQAGASGTAYLWLGTLGYLAKGVSLLSVAGLVAWAGWTHDPEKAGGLDDALATLLSQPFGPWLTAAVGLGFGCFGGYCLAWARHLDT